MNKEKIVFLGTPYISSILLEGLINNNFNVALVVTKEDKIRGRNNKVVESEVATIANKYSIPVIKPRKLNNEFDEIKKIQPDLLLTFAYGQILSSDVLSLSKYKPLNVHGSLLPKYRGASPIQEAIKNGDKETGISIIEMINKMDAGPIYHKEKILIDSKDNYSSLSEKMAKEAIIILNKFLPKYFQNKVKPINQEEEKATYCSFIKKEEYKLSLDEDIPSFINHVRYLSFTPGTYFNFNSEILKIYEVEDSSYNDNKLKVGSITINNKELLLKLKKGFVKIKKLQLPGKKIISDKDFINGFHFDKDLIVS